MEFDIVRAALTLTCVAMTGAAVHLRLREIRHEAELAVTVAAVLLIVATVVSYVASPTIKP